MNRENVLENTNQKINKMKMSRKDNNEKDSTYFTINGNINDIICM